MACTPASVKPPKVVAVATDKYLKPTHPFADPEVPGPPPRYGQDFTFGTGRPAPRGYSVADSEPDLKWYAAQLLKEFASDDATGMAKRLFQTFLDKQTAVSYFSDIDLNEAAAAHPNIDYFCRAALGAPIVLGQASPVGQPPAPGVTRIHQALKAAGWDLAKLVAPTDLGVPAFNNGSTTWGSGDYGNGLGVMVNGVQHAFVLATGYRFDATTNTYCIALKYVFLDVFGLDDDDLLEYGASSSGLFHTTAGEGITAWWQLQHQRGYAPLVTRIVVEKVYEAMAI